jgi:hypothetical protein
MKLLSKMNFECINKENGCEEVINYESLSKHELCCKYEIIECGN